MATQIVCGILNLNFIRSLSAFPPTRPTHKPKLIRKFVDIQLNKLCTRGAGTRDQINMTNKQKAENLGKSDIFMKNFTDWESNY